MREFGRALSEAISESGEASRRLRALREEGYSLYLLLDGEGRPCPDSPGGARLRTRDAREAVPVFRVDRSDVQFLRSIGIDPTRPPARRRKA